MKSKKCWISLVLIPALVIAVVLVGCGKRSETQSLQILAITPLTGPAGSFGEMIARGMQMAIEDIKAEGEVAPTLTLQDSKGQSSEAVTIFNNALAKARKPDVVISVLSGITKAITPLAEENKILVVATATVATGITEGYQYIVRAFPNATQLGDDMGKYAATQVRKCAILHQNDDYGLSAGNVFSDVYQANGGSIVFRDAFDPKATDHRSLVQKALTKNPEGFYVVGYGPAFVSVMNTIQTSGAGLSIFCDLGPADPTLLEQIKGEKNRLVFMGTDVELNPSPSPKIEEFRKRYESRFNAPLGFNATFAYDTIQLIVHVARTKKKDVSLAQALRSAPPYEGISGRFEVKADGETIVPIRVLEFAEGKVILAK